MTRKGFDEPEKVHLEVHNGLPKQDLNSANQNACKQEKHILRCASPVIFVLCLRRRLLRQSSQWRDRKWLVSDRTAGLIKTHRPSMHGGL